MDRDDFELITRHLYKVLKGEYVFPMRTSLIKSIIVLMQNSMREDSPGSIGASINPVAGVGYQKAKQVYSELCRLCQTH